MSTQNKVISANTMTKLEKRAYQQGVIDEDFMEEAGKNIARHIENSFSNANAIRDERILLLCGKGNNGGDAFVTGRYLRDRGFHVAAVQLDYPENCSPLCQVNRRRFINAGGVVFNEYARPLTIFTLIIDGLFGTGFKGKILDPYADLIETANLSRIPIYAIDIPSGLNADTGEVDGPVIRADRTFFLEFPKTGYFLGRGWDFVGQLMPISFGLSPVLIDETKPEFEIIMKDMLNLPRIERSWQKYQRGHVVGLAGSHHMPGASILSSLAALRGGAGIVRLLYPEGMDQQLTSAPYELIKIPYQPADLESLLFWLNKASATFIGPGLGKSAETAETLRSLIRRLDKPSVIDADALTLLGETITTWPKNTILTPHTGEISYLLPKLKPFTYSLQSLNECQRYVEEKKVTLICKGPVTFVFHPGKTIQANITSDPGMATAGSGDVLTGLVAALLAQGLSTHEAAILGVFLHGCAGQKAAEKYSTRSMIASDIIERFGEVFKELSQSKRFYE